MACIGVLSRMCNFLSRILSVIRSFTKNDPVTLDSCENESSKGTTYLSKKSPLELTN